MTTKGSKSATSKKSKKATKSAAKKAAVKSSRKKRSLRGSLAIFGAEASAPEPTPIAGDNGMRSFAMHSQDQPVSFASFFTGGADAASLNAPDMSKLDAETAARHYLQGALASTDLPSFSAPEVGGDKGEFRILGTEAVELTGTQTVKFRQIYRKIPVYGSLVTVELDKDNNMVSLNSGLGEPSNVNPVASISPAQALEVVKRCANYGSLPLDATPRLFYYYDNQNRRWRLVYITEDVRKITPAEQSPSSLYATPPTEFATGFDGLVTDLPSLLPEYYDYVIDAHTGELVVELPRTHNIEIAAKDGLGANRRIEVTTVAGQKALLDKVNNISTHDFRFRNISEMVNFNALPGTQVTAPLTPAAVSAHANATEVAKFLRNVLKRNGLDNLGSPIVSSINCVDRIGTKEWRNAAWIGARKQMVYGQRDEGGKLRSYAVSLDVVAHEVLHGLTDSTAKLVYLGMSGALNESYSDIFGIIVSNLNQSDIGKWNWQLGEDLSLNGIPIRDMSDPAKHNQPAHMNDYRNLPLDRAHDNGGVHINSGIHNKAAFNLLTTKNAQGRFLFDPKSVAGLFYLTLTQQLAPTSGFSDSRRGAEVSARTLFKNDADKDTKLQAVSEAFDKVGIS